jgi:hypothetical protein
LGYFRELLIDNSELYRKEIEEMGDESEKRNLSQTLIGKGAGKKINNSRRPPVYPEYLS